MIPTKFQFIWLRGFRLKCEKLADDRRRTPSDGKRSHYLWNTHGKKTQFKKGHKFTSTLKESYTENYSSSSVFVVQRSSSEEFADALYAQSTCKCDVDILPTKLRPVKIEDAILCCKIKLCSEQKLLYFVNAQLL
jgi:hypothetical protein